MECTLDLPERQSLLDALRESGHELADTSCNGRGICGKCKVRVISGECSPASESEREKLGHDYPTYRLACQTMARGTVVLDIPEPPSKAHICADYMGTVTVDADRDGLGVALDIGTTTLALFLADLRTGEILGRRAALNAQRKFGADVISRIDYCNEHPDGLQTLQRTITGQLAAMISELLESCGHAETDLKAISVAANTTMLHLLTGEDPEGLAHAPFEARFLDERQFPASDIGLPFPDCTVSLIGGISAYVGADITSGIHSCNLEEDGKVNLLLDLGTNGEIALWDKDRLVTCSCAAGPVFEGACISCGTGSIEGAVSKVSELGPEGALGYETIGGKQAIGLCGSGIIDLASLLVRRGIVDETGAMESPFVLEGTGLSLTQRDIREIQLAKAAIAGGVHTLLDECRLPDDAVDRIFLAGGLGTYLRPESAVGIGILEPEWEQRVVPVGNASLKGALQHLLGKAARERMQQIRSDAQYIELSCSSHFQELYVERMVFGE